MTESCNICGSTNVALRGVHAFYIDYKAPTFDCIDCGCRFTHRDDNIYEHLHSSNASSYAGHRRYARKLREIFETGSASELRAVLAQFDKNQLIMDVVDNAPIDSNILEIGCSCGYLTSYSIKIGRNVLGVDLSPSAIDSAKENFGDYFVTSESTGITKRAPYDLVYHVGTIGCVDDPIGFTRTYYDLLSPGGSLVFNCPNVNHCKELGLDWTRSCSPPDLVSLFSRGVWKKQFGDHAQVEIYELVKETPKFDLAAGLGAMMPRSYLFKATPFHWRSVAQRFSNRLAPVLTRIGKLAGSVQRPTEYGLHVKITKPC